MGMRRLISTLAALLCAAVHISCSGSERPPQMALPQEINASDLVRWFDDAGVPRTSVDWAEIDRLHEVHLKQVLRVRTSAARALRDIAPCTYEFNDAVKWPRLMPAQSRAAASVQARLIAESRALEEEFLFSLRSVNGVVPEVPAMLVARRGIERVHQVARASQTAGFLYAATSADPLTLLAQELRRGAADGNAGPSTTDLCTAFTEIAARSQPAAERWWQAVGAFSMAGALEYERGLIVAERQQQAQSAAEDGQTQQPAAVDADLPPLADTTQKATDRAIERLLDYERTVADALDSQSNRLPASTTAATRDVLVDSALQFVRQNVLLAIRVGIEHPKCSASTRAALREIRARVRAACRRAESLASLRSTLDRASLSLSAEVKGNDEVAQAVQFALKHGRAPDPPQPAQTMSDEPEEDHRLSFWCDLGALPHRIDTNRVCAVSTAAGLDMDTCLIIAAAADARYRALEKDVSARVEAGESQAGEAARGLDEEHPTRAARAAVQTFFSHLQSVRSLLTDTDTALIEDIRLRCALQGLPARPATMLLEALRASCAPSQQSIRRRLGDGWFRFHVAFDTLASGCVALLVIDDELPQHTRDLLGAMMAVSWDELLPAMRETSAAREQSLRDIVQLILVHKGNDGPEERAELSAILRRYRSAEAVWERIEDRIVNEVCTSLPDDADGRTLRAVRAMRRFPEMFTGNSTPIGRDFENARALADRLPDAAFDALSPQLDALDGEVVAAVRAAMAALPTSAPAKRTIAALVTEQPELRSLSMRRVNAAVRAARDAGLEIPPSVAP